MGEDENAIKNKCIDKLECIEKIEELFKLLEHLKSNEWGLDQINMNKKIILLEETIAKYQKIRDADEGEEVRRAQVGVHYPF